MSIKEIRAIIGMSQADFAEKYNIPLKSIQNWEQGVRKCPQYVLELLEFKVRHDVIS